MDSWLKLDNAAKIFPAVSSDRLTHYFRLSVRLKEPVRPDVLESALHAVVPRFPAFRFRLEAGVFWYTLVDDASLPPIYPDSASPGLPFRRGRRGPHLFRIRWFARRLAVEFHHALTDGMGGLTFLRALTAEYLHQLGVVGPDPENLRRVDRPPDPEESTDAFQNLHEPSFPRVAAWDRAYRPPPPLLPRGRYAVTTGRIPLSRLREEAKSQNASLTEYLAATLLAVFQQVYWERPGRPRPFRLVVPVNLRTVFPSKTLRNFFVVVPVEIDPRLGRYEWDEILRKVHHQLQSEMDPKLLQKQIVRNLRGELNPVARLLPLPLKNLVLTGVHRAYEERHTASLSNLGRCEWPTPWANAIDGVDFTPPANPVCPVNAGVISFGDTLTVTFGSLLEESSVERAFFTLLRKRGLPVFVESNRNWEEGNALLSTVRG